MAEFFERFSREDAEAVRKLGSPVAVRRGETLFERGDEARRFFWIDDGRMDVVVTSPQGKNLVLRRLGAGDVIGEIAIFTGARRTATLVAAEDSRLFAVDSRDLRDLVQRRPTLAVALLGILSERTRALTEQLEDSFFLPMRARLAKTLLELAEESGRETDDGVLLAEPLSQALLGRLVYASREEVNRELGRWSKQGWIRRRDGLLELLDPGALAELLSDPTARGGGGG
ncbi:MAG: Crp/Fnr family transcriptional regulator [Myxococcales bacterium]|nr:Crp/Fnr family transcriptional regulator [Myxococcales bacterium]